MLLKDRNLSFEEKIISSNEDIIKAERLLFDIFNASLTAVGDHYEVEVNGSRKGLSSLYRECRKRMEMIAEIGPKADFLAMVVLENTFETALPLLFFSVKDVIEGNDAILRDVRELREIFEDNQFKANWKQKEVAYVTMQQKLGLTMSERSNGLNQYVDPLVDAFGFYLNEYQKSHVYKIRKGRMSNERPDVAANICKYASEKEFVDSIAKCGRKCVIAFGSVEKTMRQTTDPFYEWYRGYPEERQRNWMKHEKLTADEFLNHTDPYSRCVYLCVKSDETIWLMAMPYNTETYGGTYEDASSKYAYGKRAGYAPYEIFFKETPPAPEGSTYVSFAAGGWKLNALMDDQSKIWLPVFIEETYQYFFASEPDSTELIFPEEITTYYISSSGQKEWIVPQNTAFPAAWAFDYKVSAPLELFEESYMKELMAYFHLSVDDIRSAPVLPYKSASSEETEERIERNVKAAYIKTLAEKIADFLFARLEHMRDETLEFIFTHQSEILERAVNGEFDAFCTVIIDGAKVLDPEGNEVLYKSSTYPYNEVPSITHTSVYDGRYPAKNDLYNNLRQPFVIWVGKAKDRKPPVLFELSFRNAEGYAALFQTTIDELDDGFRLSGAILEFYEQYHNKLPDSLTNKYPLYYGKKTESIYLPPLANINICMTKREYKQTQKARKN